MSLKDEAINLHRMLKGKIEIQSRISVENLFEEEKGTLGLIYTPGVAYASKEISRNKELVYDYTSKWNNVAIVCDGTRVLGLGNVGPEAAIPVMEGKAVLFKILGGINAFPLCISTQDKDEIIRFVKEIEPIFGAINIEDIESPKVLEIVEGLQGILSIPIFHDDQHGTAVITLAALINALRVVGKKLDAIKLVIAGAGSAGYGIVKILHEAGCQDIVVTDSKGALWTDRESSGNNNNNSDDVDAKNRYKSEIRQKTNPRKLTGNLAHVIEGADVFIGVSGKGGLVNAQMIESMNRDAIVFALSNPDPEILPSDALQGRARIVATGRSDFPNQINNAVVFPSVLRVLLDIRAKTLSQDMLVAVAGAIAGIVDDTQLKEDYIIPKVNDPRILPTVTKALRDAIERHVIKKDNNSTT
ncbi:MAG TPA: NADP-dependent malic enzyme [Nitrososphaera sp.]|nr:NADP-dependent malic enzyme [Nitrososphaera sp.]